MIIISTAPGCKTISIDLPWRDMDFSKEIRCDVLENGGREQGTEITIYYDEADILEGKSYKKPTVTSFRNYAKLIETGSLTIIYNGVVQEIDEPELKELKDYGKVSNQGFEFELTMGELKENCKAPYGFYIYSKETLRYIKAGSKALDEDTDAIQGLYICIALSSSKKDWRISKNKNEVLNVGVIADSWVFRNALEYWKTKIKKAKSSEMFEEIEDDFSKFMKYGVVTGLQGSRPNKGNDSNSVKPRGSNKKLNVWENVKLNPSGTAQKRSNREQSKIKEIKVRSVHFTNGNIDSLLSIDKSNNIINVNLNSNNKFISELSDNNKPSISKKLVLEQIVGLALGTNDIRGDQLQINLVDLVFIQHEIFRQTERFDNIQI